MARSNRVLVVSPDPGLVNQVRGSLISIDIVDVSDVPNGEEALERCEAGGPRLVIAEVDLPGITGHELCRRLKSNDDGPAVALIFRHGDDRAEEHCNRAGAEATAARPFQAQELAERLNAVVTSPAFNAPQEFLDSGDDANLAGEEDSVGDESMYSDYEFGVDESVDGMRSIDTGSIRPAITAELEAVRERGEFDEAEHVSDLHADSSVRIASLHTAEFDDSLNGDPFQSPPLHHAPRIEVGESGAGGGGTLRDMVAEHLNELTSEGSDFRNELKTLIRETVTSAVLSAAGGTPDDSDEDTENS